MLPPLRLDHHHILPIGVGRRTGLHPGRRHVHVERVGQRRGIAARQGRTGQLGDVRPDGIEDDGALGQGGFDLVEGHPRILKGRSARFGDARNLPPLGVVGRASVGIEKVFFDGCFEIVKGEESGKGRRVVVRVHGGNHIGLLQVKWPALETERCVAALEAGKERVKCNLR